MWTFTRQFRESFGRTPHAYIIERRIDRAIAALAAGAASAVNLLDVEGVVIGGGLGTRFGDVAVERIRDAMQTHLFRPEAPPTVSVTELGDLGGAIGAARLIQ